MQIANVLEDIGKDLLRLGARKVEVIYTGSEFVDEGAERTILKNFTAKSNYVIDVK